MSAEMFHRLYKRYEQLQQEYASIENNPFITSEKKHDKLTLIRYEQNMLMYGEIGVQNQSTRIIHPQPMEVKVVTINKNNHQKSTLLPSPQKHNPKTQQKYCLIEDGLEKSLAHHYERPLTSRRFQ